MTAYYTLEYVWIDGNDQLRSKTRVMYDGKRPKNIESIPNWNYDGSSTNQADGKDSDVILKPVAIFRDPFRGGDNKLVLCDTYDSENNPHTSNSRYNANKIFNAKLDEKPWFGLEQEYFIKKGLIPLGYDSINKQGQYYCGVGTDNAFAREIVEKHLNYCLYSGVKISGINAEVAPGQWEFQVGPCEGIQAGDHLWMARYILYRVSEEFDVIIDLSPKPLKGEWNGSGCHTNYSTEHMREGCKTTRKTGLDFINEAIVKLSSNHKEHMDVYGTGNQERMTGNYETADYNVFTDGVSNRGASIRRGIDTVKNKCGYFEDRRPSSNCDPYKVTSIIFKTTCLDNIPIETDYEEIDFKTLTDLVTCAN